MAELPDEFRHNFVREGLTEKYFKLPGQRMLKIMSVLLLLSLVNILVSIPHRCVSLAGRSKKAIA